MANGLQLPFQATSQGPGTAFTITSNVEIQDHQTVAAISGINTGPLKLVLLGGMKPPVPIGVLGDSSKNAGIGVQGNSSGNVGVQGNDSGNVGVQGNDSGIGVGVRGNSAQGAGVFGSGPTAGFFEGDVTVTGTMTINGTGARPGISTLTITGTAGMGSARIEGDANIGGDANVTGKLQCNGDAQCNGALTTKGNANVGGDANVTGTFQCNGDVHCNQTVHALQDVVLGADCAEDFDVASSAEIEPGTVMVLDENGVLEPSQSACDKKVAGVISGAGDYQPGLILGRHDSSQRRMPLALVGKVYCKTDAQYGPIEVGDLLTTSPHARSCNARSGSAEGVRRRDSEGVTAA